ncbi:MAG: hypothetical protein WBL67_14080 [Nitrososphaeraceae archaeon]
MATRNLVPISTPGVSNASAATDPRPSMILSAATTGSFGIASVLLRDSSYF